MLELFSIGGTPLPGDMIVTMQGGGELWQYKSSGLSDVWVEGGLTLSHDGYFARFHDLERLHGLIVERLLEGGALSADRFTFVRKFLGMTSGQFASRYGLGVAALESWEAGGGFAPTDMIRLARRAAADFAAQRTAA